MDERIEKYRVVYYDYAHDDIAVYGEYDTVGEARLIMEKFKHLSGATVIGVTGDLSYGDSEVPA